MDKNDKEFIDEQNLTPKESNGLPESPASANVKIWIDGFGAMITMRDKKMGKVLERLAWVINYAKEKGWQPTWEKEGTMEKKESKTKGCPDCGATMTFRSGVSKKGKKYAGWFCKENENHIEWVDAK